MVTPAAIIVLSVSLKFASAFYGRETQTACYEPGIQGSLWKEDLNLGYEANMVQSSANLTLHLPPPVDFVQDTCLPFYPE